VRAGRQDYRCTPTMEHAHVHAEAVFQESALSARPLRGAHEHYRGTLLIRNRRPSRTAIGPYAQASCRVLGGSGFL
jgi:hypothetical protein